jgi:hypothetical protein
MDQYSNIQIIEANRLHSEEAKSGNNENFSLWTNNLQDILHLYPKDQVSIYGSFISERGAGQSSSIEIKGQELGQTHQYIYTDLKKEIIAPDRLDYDLPSRASKISVVYNRKHFQIRDDELKFVINYFIPANCHNSCHLPRRWMYGRTDPRTNYIEDDSVVIHGFSYHVPSVMNHGSHYGLFQYPAFYNTRDIDGIAPGDSLMKPKNDNSRYTIMVRDTTYYTQHTASGNLKENDMRDPENATYYTYRELKDIKIPSGFNSPEFIATEISRRLQNIINDETLTQSNGLHDKFPQPVSKLIESETYKAFFTGNVDDMKRTKFLEYFNLSGDGTTASDKHERTNWGNASGFDWLRQYGVIATKYPELYETGRLINRNYNAVYQGIKGAEINDVINLNTATEDTPFELQIRYNKARCDEFKAFFDAQKLYPEIINNLNHAGSGYTPGNTIDNTRWIHINRWDYRKQSLSLYPSPEREMLGWGGYYFPRTWIPTENQQLISLLLCLYFDPNQEDIFYDKPSVQFNQLSYGCLGRSSAGNILIYPLKHAYNGLGSPPIEELRLTPTHTPGIIEVGRKIGFDLHFTAPGMYYLLPLSGWTTTPEGYNQHSTLAGNWKIPDTNQNTNDVLPGSPTYPLDPWKKLLYIGADNPQFNWDGTNFSFSDFHTGRNRGNEMRAKKTIYQKVTPEDDYASDTIYEINPRDLYNDYTPDRMPYTFEGEEIYPPKGIIGGDGNTYITIVQTNDNYQPWTIYDQLCGIMIEDFGVPEDLWTNSLWGILGFSYKQFHGTTNRQVRIQRGNSNDLSILTTNAEVVEGDTKILSTNWAGIPMYNNMITTPVQLLSIQDPPGTSFGNYRVYPNIIHKTQSIKIIADNLPTRMIRGYYTIRSNILEGSPFIGGKVNNTTMPVVGVVNKINNYGDFTFGEESSLNFTITKPIRLASITVSVHDPDGSYARTSEQSTVLFKIQRPVVTTFNVAQQILQEEMNQKNQKGKNPNL